MKTHSAADVFPLLDEKSEQFAQLVESMHGGFDPAHPVVLWRGEVLDGRNRIRAAEKAGVKPITISRDNVDPFMLAWSCNGIRRDLTTAQRYLIFRKLQAKSVTFQAELAAIAEKANKARSEKARGNKNASKGEKNSSTTKSGTTKRSGHRKGASAKASASGTNRGTVQRCEYLAKNRPELAEKVEAGELSETTAYKRAQREAKQAEYKKATAEAALDPEQFRLFVSPASELSALIEPESIDVIITDPPYDKSIEQCCLDLSALAAVVLKPGASCLVMVGQSYLPAALAALASKLTYNWVIAYLTPGGQSAQLWKRKVNTFWKPVLWFTKGNYSGEWRGDVCKSDVNDNDKKHHKWGQSESGMADLVGGYSAPADVVLDPFCGAGTTGIVCAGLGRRFIGADIDPNHVENARGRILCLKP